MQRVALFTFLIACSTPVLAQAAPTAATPAKPDPKDKVICRSEEQIGSMLGGHRECHTRREWDQMAQESRAMVDTQTRFNNPLVPH